MRLALGDRLGHYEIQSHLGSGGMGEVYRARDVRLNRVIAIKILPEELSTDRQRLSRFEREAQSASALNHQNIITIYDIGKHGTRPFIAMELVEGKTLREILSSGPVAIKDLLNIAIQLADGLACAHEAGIVHRDLKPENVIVNNNGVTKILDFGLAKLFQLGISNEEVSQAPTVYEETASGMILGTVGYMSPEQASGQPVDFKSDQFSLATILYEMATSHSPFRRKTAAETLAAIIRDKPKAIESYNPQVPDPLVRLIDRCLSKEPSERYSSTRDLVHDLRDIAEQRPPASQKSQVVVGSIGRKITKARPLLIATMLLFLVGVVIVSFWQFRGGGKVTSTDALQDPSVAVLPFTTVGNTTQEEYFSDGMTEALITEIAMIPGIKVIASNSVFSYKGRNVNIGQIAKELSVNYVVQGSVQRSGDRVRVNVKLINVRTGYHLWAHKYDRNSSDLFAVQDDISRKIGSALELNLSETKGTRGIGPTQNLQAYDFYLRGKYLLNEVDEESLNKAIPLFEKAIAIDPQFALAHAALGKIYRQKYFFVEPKKEWEEKAFVEIEKAIALDPNLAEAYTARGRLIWSRENNYPHEKAASDYKKAIALNPNLADAHAYLAGIYMHVGMLEEAIQESVIALKLDPTGSLTPGNYAMSLLFNQQYHEALSVSEKSPEDEIWKALSLLYLGNIQKSEHLMKELLKKMDRQIFMAVWDSSFIHSSYAVLLAKTGNHTAAEEHIRMTIEKDRGLGHYHHSEYNIASAYALMGKVKPAIEWVQRTGDHGFTCYPLFKNDPHLKNLHGNSEFTAFLEKMKEQTDYYRAEFTGK